MSHLKGHNKEITFIDVEHANVFSADEVIRIAIHGLITEHARTEFVTFDAFPKEDALI